MGPLGGFSLSLHHHGCHYNDSSVHFIFMDCHTLPTCSLHRHGANTLHCRLLACHCSPMACHCSVLACHCSLMPCHCSLMAGLCKLVATHCTIEHLARALAHSAVFVCFARHSPFVMSCLARTTHSFHEFPVISCISNSSHQFHALPAHVTFLSCITRQFMHDQSMTWHLLVMPSHDIHMTTCPQVHDSGGGGGGGTPKPPSPAYTVTLLRGSGCDITNRNLDLGGRAQVSSLHAEPEARGLGCRAQAYGFQAGPKAQHLMPSPRPRSCAAEHRHPESTSTFMFLHHSRACISYVIGARVGDWRSVCGPELKQTCQERHKRSQRSRSCVKGHSTHSHTRTHMTQLMSQTSHARSQR